MLIASLKSKKVFFVTLSLFVTAFLSITNYQTASAITDTADKNVKSYIYIKAFLNCGKDNAGLSLTIDELRDGYYFNNEPKEYTTIGFMYDAGGGVGCDDNKDTDWTYKALKSWGLDSSKIVENLCAFGLKRSDKYWEVSGNQNCVSGSGQYLIFPSVEDFQNNFLKKINSTYYKKSNDTSMPSLSEAEKYVLYYQSLLGGGAQFKVDYSKANQLDKSLVSKDCPGEGDCDKSYLIWGVDNDNNVFQAIYYGEKAKGRGDEITLYEGEKKSMQWISEQLTKDRAQAYADYLKKNGLTPSTASSSDSDSGSSTSSCTIPAIGWILCPVFSTLASVADSSYSFISKNFLEFNSGLFNTSDSDTAAAAKALLDAWSASRNIANIGIVIAFLVIIISQITGFGITNYGIKKMLPRLIIAVILINLSYIIVQGAIDISNILGASIYDSFNNLATSTLGTGQGIQPKSAFADMATKIQGGATILGVAGVVLWGAIGTLGPVLIAAVVGLLMIFFILVLRQVIIILLIVLAPLAFLAYLLPNTEKLFTQWRKTLTAVLIVYPLCSLVFGASAFASELLKLVYK